MISPAESLYTGPNIDHFILRPYDAVRYHYSKLVCSRVRENNARTTNKLRACKWPVLEQDNICQSKTRVAREVGTSAPSGHILADGRGLLIEEIRRSRRSEGWWGRGLHIFSWTG